MSSFPKLLLAIALTFSVAGMASLTASTPAAADTNCPSGNCKCSGNNCR